MSKRNKAEADVSRYARQYAIEAVDGLRSIARDPSAPAETRMTAWREILSRGVPASRQPAGPKGRVQKSRGGAEHGEIQ